MSDTFIVAASLPMTREAYEQWLDAPLPAPNAFDDWSAMYKGWYWENVTPTNPSDDPGATTARDWIKGFANGGIKSQLSICLAVHQDDHLRFYASELMGPLHDRAQEALSMLRAASAFVTAPGYAAYWAETGGRLVEPKALLSLCAIDGEGSRFVPRAAVDADAAIEMLQPVDDLYCELIDAMGEESSSPRSEVFMSERFIDPAISGVEPPAGAAPAPAPAAKKAAAKKVAATAPATKKLAPKKAAAKKPAAKKTAAKKPVPKKSAAKKAPKKSTKKAPKKSAAKKPAAKKATKKSAAKKR